MKGGKKQTRSKVMKKIRMKSNKTKAPLKKNNKQNDEARMHCHRKKDGRKV